MLYTKFSTMVKAVRLRYAISFVLLLAAIYLMVIHPWMANWGSTAAERQMALPGDELIPDDVGQSTLAITINAPSDVVWQWLVQVGQDRAGFYTYTWLENLVGADIHNTDEICPKWQHLAVGDAWRLVPADYLWGMGKDAAVPVLVVEPGHALVLEMFGAHVLVPIDEHTTRLIVRGQSGPANLFITMVWKPIVFTLERRMLFGLKARAEGRPDAPAALMAIAQLGWAVAGITVAGLFLSQRRRWFWLAPPVLAALPALLMGHDVQAGLAAFLGVGIPMLGFLTFGRNWWGSLLVIGSLVLLTLLLTPEAYTAIGLAFALLLLAALGAMVAARFRALGGAAHRLTTPTRWRGWAAYIQFHKGSFNRKENVMLANMNFIKRYPLLAFFALVFAISWGGVLLVIGGPGKILVTREQIETLLPFAILTMLVGPSVAGLLLTGLVYGRVGLHELFSGLFRWRVGARWYAVALLSAPLMATAILLALLPTSPVFLPGIFASDDKATFLLLGITAGLVVGIFEELGWTGFAISRLRLRYGILATGLILGFLWGAWHSFLAFWGSGTSSGALSLILFLPEFLYYVTVLPVYRVLMVWVYERTGSLLVAMLMHASLTASVPFILMPLAISGMPLVTWYLVLAAVLWVFAVVVLRRQTLHQPAREVHFGQPAHPSS